MRRPPQPLVGQTIRQQARDEGLGRVSEAQREGHLPLLRQQLAPLLRTR